MLDALKKRLGTESVAADMEALTSQLEASKLENSKLVQDMQELVTANTDLTAQLNSLKEQLSQLEAVKAEMVAKAEADKLSARKAKLVSLIGTTKADATFEATKSLDDGSFDAVCAALSVSLTAESNSPLFKEQGVDAVANVDNVNEETYEARELRKMFQK